MTTRYDRDFINPVNPQEILNRWATASEAEKLRYFVVEVDPNTVRDIIRSGKSGLSSLGKKMAMATAIRINSIMGNQDIVRDLSKPLPNQEWADDWVASIMAQDL